MGGGERVAWKCEGSGVRMWVCTRRGFGGEAGAALRRAWLRVERDGSRAAKSDGQTVTGSRGSASGIGRLRVRWWSS